MKRNIYLLVKIFRLFLIAALSATLSTGGSFFLGASPVWANATVSIVDTLGAATPATQFSLFGAGGVSIFGGQFAGPEFTLTQPTVLTEIGGFVNNCDSIVSGVPQCPTTLPFTVQIRPSTNGVPDASTVLASFALSHDNNPLVVSYESVAINLTLQAGTYFALFAAQGNDGGFLLGNASDPFSYLPGTINMGLLFPTTGASSTQGSVHRAVRILGSSTTSTGVGIDIKPGSSSNPINLKNKGVIPVAILTTPTFDATTVDSSTVCFGDAEDPSQRDCTEAHRKGHIQDVDGDGDLDLVLHYETRQTGIDRGDTQACLTGKTFGGVDIEDCDTVRVR